MNPSEFPFSRLFRPQPGRRISWVTLVIALAMTGGACGDGRSASEVTGTGGSAAGGTGGSGSGGGGAGNGGLSADGGQCTTPAPEAPGNEGGSDGSPFGDGTGKGFGDGGGLSADGTSLPDGNLSTADGSIVPGDGGLGADGPGAGIVDEPVTDTTGIADTHFSPAGTTNPFVGVQLGPNGRFCETCHGIFTDWTLSADKVVERFNTDSLLSAFSGASNANATSNDDMDPLFRANDGANSPTADVSSPSAREAAYSLLLRKALIRVGLPVPGGAEFALAAVDDPYGYATPNELSLFRRPLPTSNLRFLTDLMWDGRENAACQTLSAMLGHQANAAARGHGQAQVDLAAGDRDAIVAFERTIYFAQTSDNDAGALDEAGAIGGVLALADQPFYVGINAFPGPDPKGAAFDPNAFTLFDAWSNLPQDAPRRDARAAIARGQAIFNTRAFTIENVKGLNDDLSLTAITGTCTTCHNTPNVGGNSSGLRFDIGISNAGRRTADIPLYTLRLISSGETIETTDPGRALISGKWKDVGRFKVPGLRGLTARPPYFHDGSAATVRDVVDYKNARFAIGLTDAEKADLVSFLATL